MSDPKEPTIRLSTCRQDGRCPECGEGSAFPFRLLCGCSPCLSSACSLNHTRALLTEALRQRDYGPRIVATVAKDEIAKLREERDAAIRERDILREDVRQAAGELLLPIPEPGSEVARLIVANRLLRYKIAEAERERDEARAQLVDLAHGYALDITASRALGKLTLERADRAEALLAEARTEHRDISERYIAASSARIRAEALLRECVDAVRVAASAEEDYGALDRARELDALLGKIREALGVAK